MAPSGPNLLSPNCPHSPPRTQQHVQGYVPASIPCFQKVFFSSGGIWCRLVRPDFMFAFWQGISVWPWLGSNWFPNMGEALSCLKNSSQSDYISKWRSCSLCSCRIRLEAKQKHIVLWGKPSVQISGNLLTSLFSLFQIKLFWLLSSPWAPSFVLGKYSRLLRSLVVMNWNSTPISADWSYHFVMIWVFQLAGSQTDLQRETQHEHTGSGWSQKASHDAQSISWYSWLSWAVFF